jgi:hypothetical protein
VLVHGPGEDEERAQHRQEDLISRFELLAGAKTGPRQRLIGDLPAALSCLPWTTLRPTEPPKFDATLNARAWASAWRTA